ncbi:MAG: T9SS type A sorting domain-containing protein [Crocinitomicaceae bacterium]|nr:T9SS type A sorting domain-containing protein [Crocinitomicaceae bacterium]
MRLPCVIYRNTCEFGYKALQAQNAGAIAVIILNREDAYFSLQGGTEGLSVTIPVVLLSNIDGAILTNAMAGGPVEMLIGNKQNAFVNDVGAIKGEFLVSPFGGAHNLIYDGFTPGIQVYNFGSADQTDVMINAKIDGPSGNYYDETIGPLALLSGDTIATFPGNTDEFIAWQLGVGSYDDGDYTLTYTLSMSGLTDDSDFDNIYTSDFKIQSDHLSLARLDGGNMPIGTSYPSNSTTEYQSCMMFQATNASALNGILGGVDGMYFIAHTDTSINEFAGAEIFANAYQWDDAWGDLDDPTYQFDPATNDAFQNLNLITFGTHYPASNDDVDDVAFIAFTTPFQLDDNQRYLFCLQTFESATISFGYDGDINYDGNQGIIRQPISPIHIDGQWFTQGWYASSASSIALSLIDGIGIEETNMVEGNAFPNPATDKVTISIDANGDATLEVVDIAGKVTMNSSISLVNGSANVDMSSLESGVYIFNVTLENGQTSQFNVVKK